MNDMSNHKLNGQFIYDGMVFCELTTRETLDKVKTYPLTKDDLLVATYPKSGTTWTQEIIWLIMNDTKLSTESMVTRFPFLELTYNGVPSLESLQPGPKLLKTHLPYSFFAKPVSEEHTKVIVNMRNVRDTLVSFYKMYQMCQSFGNFPGPWSEFFALFKQKRLLYGDWLEYNLSWWEQRHLDNVLMVFYEDLKEDPEKEIKRISEFCGKDLSDDTISRIAKLTTFEAMKENPATNYEDSPLLDHSISPFMRKGQVGDWKNYFTEEQLAYVKTVYEPKLKSAGLNFKYEV